MAERGWRFTTAALRLAALLLAAVSLLGSPAVASPTTQDFMNAMTVCGLGSHITMDNGTKEKVQMMLDQGAAQGKVSQEITAEILATVVGPHPELYEKYVKCLHDVMSYDYTPEGRQEALLKDLTEDTPVATIERAYDQPSRIVSSFGITTSEYSGHDHFLYLIRGGQQLLAYALAVTDPAKADRKRIPLLGLGEYNEATGKVDDYMTFNAITVGWLTNRCDNFSAVLIDPRHGYFTTTQCYFGAPGRYKNFYFGFNGDDVTEPCHGTSLYDWQEPMPLRRVACAGVQAMHPEFVLVQIADLDPSAAETLANKVQGYRYSGVAPNLVNDIR